MRQCTNELMQIKHDRDVLDDDDLYEFNTPKKRKMASYENDEDVPGPDLNPMLPNWDKIDGKWNEELFKLFIAYCKDNGEEDRIGTDEEEYEIHEMFMDRLRRLKNLISRWKPKNNERKEAMAERLSSKHKEGLQRQRRHTRRGQVSRNWGPPG